MPQLISIKSLFAAFALVFFAANAIAETKMAVLDQNRALFSSDAARVETEKLKKEYGDDEVRIIKLEETIKEAQAKLETDAAIMEQTDIENMQLQINEQLAERQSLVDKLKKIQNQRRGQFIRQYQPLMAESIRSVVDEMGIQMVFDSAALVYAEPTLDITEKVLIRFNEKFKAQN